MDKVFAVTFAIAIVALVALASFTGYLYIQTSQSLAATNANLKQYQTQIARLQAQIDALNQQQAQNGGSTPGILAQLSTMSALLLSIRNSLNSSITPTLRSELASLQEQLDNVQAVEAGCAGSVSVPQRPVGNLTPVLVMQPNTTGAICVTYRAAWSDDPSRFAPLISSWEAVYLKNGSYPFMIYIGNSSARGDFTITPIPDTIRPSENVTYVTVLYNVSALARSKGIYDYSAPYGYCDSMPMAVGFNASQLKPSDFSPRPPPHSCVAELYAPVSVGVVGMGVTYIDISPSRSYLITNTGAGSCSQTGPGYSGNVPCFTYDRSQAYVFNCTATAATPAGCTLSFGSGFSAYNITVWYPDTNKSFSGANCAYAVSNPTGQTPRTFEDCIPVTSSSFIVAGQFEPLT